MQFHFTTYNNCERPLPSINVTALISPSNTIGHVLCMFSLHHSAALCFFWLLAQD